MRRYVILGIFALLLPVFFGCAQDGNDNSVQNVTGNEREIEVTAVQWEYTPDPITVNQGDFVRLRITSADVTHGFVLPEYGINERLEPESEVIVEFVADEAGEFDFWCNVPCGRGHSGMRGTLIVNER